MTVYLFKVFKMCNLRRQNEMGWRFGAIQGELIKYLLAFSLSS